MSTTDDLRDIAMDVTGDGTVTESQEESPSHDPVGEEETRIVEDVAAGTDDGLDEAIEGTERSGGGESVS